jgi:hypothetical protein
MVAGVSEDAREPGGVDLEVEEEERPKTPFDHPAFLPVLLIGFMVWFGYDGWFNPDMEWIKFNRYGFGFLVGGSIYATLQALRGDLPLLGTSLLTGYALWLGWLGWLGAEGSWYNDTPAAELFNRWACGASALLAALGAVRHRLRAGSRARGSAAE